MVAAMQAEEGLTLDDAHRLRGLEPLLEGSPHGVVYLIGPERAPIGYVTICFGWSLEFGGLDGFVDEIYVRPAVRGRGIASDVLARLAKALKEAGMTALHLEVNKDNARAKRLYERAHFRSRDQYLLMTRMF